MGSFSFREEHKRPWKGTDLMKIDHATPGAIIDECIFNSEH